jgi:UDP-N-acetylmuramoyl-L-alanyl-D-glutamate--2,6-diaminopimelate ligase
MTVGALFRSVDGASVPPEAAGVRVRHLTDRSDDAGPGSLYFAVPGTKVDGHDFLPDVVKAGAAGAVVEHPVELPGAGNDLPLIRVPTVRRALAEAAATWFGSPAERLELVGITGTIGKTSVLNILDAILEEAGVRAASIGSLGVKIGQDSEETGYTAPDALRLQEALAGIVDADCPLAAMEVTTHALDQFRVHGVRFDLGVFTNLVPLEHMEYHGSFRHYVEAKSRYFDHLKPGAPVVHSAADRAVRRLVRTQDITPIPCGPNRSAAVRIEQLRMGAEGTRFELVFRRPLPRLHGDPLPPTSVAMRLPVLGRANVMNAALAATASACLGAPPEAAARALVHIEAARRRMQLAHQGRFSVLDDTVGHPESVSAVFEVVESLAPRRIHAVVSVRGMRGRRVNRQIGEALVVWNGHQPIDTLLVTTAEDHADERNRVDPAEREAFLAPLREKGVPYTEVSQVAEAVPRGLEAAGEGDLVLLLGAQAMDRAGEMAGEWLAAHPERA